MGGDHAIDEPVLARLLGGEVVVAIHVLVDPLERLTGVAGIDLVDMGAFGSSAARVGVHVGKGELARRLVATLDSEQNLSLRRYKRASEVERGVEQGEVEAGLLIPDSYDASLRAGAGSTLDYLGRPDTLAAQLGPTIQAAVARQSELIRAARLLEAHGGPPFAESLRRASRVSKRLAPISVGLTDPSGEAYPQAQGQFDTSASTQLLLFIFFTSLTGAGALIETRRLGVARRMLSTPTSLRTVLLGAGLGRLAIAVLQALIAMLGALALGVN